MDTTPNLPPRVNIIGDICLADCATTHSILQQKKYFSQILKLRAHFPNHPIKTIRLDNAGEIFFFFFPKAFHDYCLSFGIYVGFHSTSIIQYLEPLTGNLFTARFANCHFDESVFPPLGGDKPINNKWREITWNTPSLLHLDPRTKQSELEVQRILHLQDLADQLSDAFIDPNKVNLISCLLL